MFTSRFRPFVAFAAVEPGAPAAPSAPAGQPPGFGDASAAAQARIDEAFPQPLQPGTPADVAAAAQAPAVEDAPFDIFADDALETLDLENLQYRDGARIAKEIASARDRFKPFNDAFGGLNDDQRNALIENAPTLGSDLATFSALAPQLHPDDRAYMMRAMELMATDPARAAQMLAEGATLIQQAFPGAAPAPAAPAAEPNPWDPPAELPPEEQPLTRADLERELAAREYQGEVKRAEDDIRARAKELGYDPESANPADDARFRTFIAMAGRPEVNGDLDRAHALMGEMDQAIIDRFVQAKSADAERPGAPVTGAAPAQPPQAMDTLDDARAAANLRLDSVLGPDPRRRG